METPLISIIVPVYNVQRLLPRCLESLKKQTYPKLEFVIVDDGSTDGSGVTCDEFKKHELRARIVHQQNLGLSEARNRGIREATGDYITFVDSDDYILPDFAQYLFSLISKYQTRIAICGIKEITAKNKEIDYASDYPEKVMSTEETLGRMLREEGFTVTAYAKLYHKSLWQNVKFPAGALHEDLGTTYKVIKNCPRIAFGPEAKYIYVKRASSISSTDFSSGKYDIIRLTDEMCDEIEARFPYLINTVNLRRMHARFSVLRQMVLAKELGSIDQAREQEIIDYLKEHKKFVTKNPYATSRDKLAIYTLLIHKNIFKLAWQIYSKLRP
ncbi:glycosyltransferase family 2 protein [Candidatus Saccharibacteria bacterium]|nr:glycosyltransferase family 2 protein [Candidatus Saccharibacteria bacterium]